MSKRERTGFVEIVELKPNMKKKSPFSVYHHDTFTVRVCGYGTRASHLLDLRRLIANNFGHDSEVLTKTKPKSKMKSKIKYMAGLVALATVLTTCEAQAYGPCITNEEMVINLCEGNGPCPICSYVVLYNSEVCTCTTTATQITLQGTCMAGSEAFGTSDPDTAVVTLNLWGKTTQTLNVGWVSITCCPPGQQPTVYQAPIIIPPDLTSITFYFYTTCPDCFAGEQTTVTYSSPTVCQNVAY